MSFFSLFRLLLPTLILSLVCFPSLLPADAPPEVKSQDYTGKVVPLAGLLEKFGAQLDPEAAPQWLALAATDGKVYPLIRDDGARMFFQDERLLNRPMVLTGRLYPETHLLQVLSVHSIVKGRLCEVYYWCSVCSIKGYEKKPCPCCGAPMELREDPVQK
ncbi:MAG: hypothetical protein JO112_09500 [Planctomycetes bacterium]|nr:hypothetical protein [Planctomycetota bacterium]